MKDGRCQRDFLAEQQATAAGQFPAGVLLSCIDSRAPAEILFNLGMGDIFNARIAGNIANPDILGSMEFTTKLAGAKVVLVMAHSAGAGGAGRRADPSAGPAGGRLGGTGGVHAGGGKGRLIFLYSCASQGVKKLKPLVEFSGSVVQSHQHYIAASDSVALTGPTSRLDCHPSRLVKP